MAPPLTGITVIDCSTVVAGPMCSMILGDLGADVIKVEAPGGDVARVMGPPFKGELSGLFANLNRNKRSIVLDLQNPDGFDALTTLVESADIFLHNFRPGVSERLGIDAATLLGLNHRLIYCGVTGFGKSGPLAAQPCYDTVIQGLSGMTAVQGEGGAPELVKTLLVDKVAGLTMAYGIQAALFARVRTGHGQVVDLNLLDSFVSFLFPDAFMRHTFLPEAEFAGGPSMGSLHRTWQARDGYLTIIMVTDAQFAGLARACGRPELAEDARFADLPSRVQNYSAVEQMLVPLLKTRTVAEWLPLFRENGVPATPVHTLETMTREPQIIANGTFVEFRHPSAGPMRAPQPPTQFNGQRLQIERGAPRLGEHSTEILAEFGVAEEAIAAYMASGAVRQG